MQRKLPEPPKLINIIGPSFILLGLALGSGEIIMWPYLSALWGLGLLWGGFLGITFQFVLNLEIMRYTLAWGESVFMGFKKMSKLLPFWFIVSTFIPWSLPGFSSASSEILAHLFGVQSNKFVPIVILIFVGFVLSFGKYLHKTMENLQKTAILIGLPFLILIAFLVTKSTDWTEALVGLIGKGNGWWFLPQGVALSSFLGAFAYAGAGGNLNFAQSYYIKERGFGMGRYSDKITSLFTLGAKNVDLEGATFIHSEENHTLWKKWWKVVFAEHFIVFWFLGLVTIIITSVLAKSLVFGNAQSAGIEFLYQEAAAIGTRVNPVFGIIFLLIAAVMLFSTQIGVLESSSRIISENILLIFHKPGLLMNPSKAFYSVLWSQILLGIITLLAGVKDPRLLLTVSAVLNALAMLVAFPLIFLLNKRNLHHRYHPSFPIKIFLLSGFILFVYFVGITLKGLF